MNGGKGLGGSGGGLVLRRGGGWWRLKGRGGRGRGGGGGGEGGRGGALGWLVVGAVVVVVDELNDDRGKSCYYER